MTKGQLQLYQINDQKSLWKLEVLKKAKLNKLLKILNLKELVKVFDLCLRKMHTSVSVMVPCSH